MREFIVRQTDLTKERNRNAIYTLFLPDVSEKDFYKQTKSLNAFFHNPKKKRNWSPDGRLFTLLTLEEYEIDKEINEKYLKLYDIKYTQHSGITFNGIYEFYNYIGYNGKTKKREKIKND